MNWILFINYNDFSVVSTYECCDIVGCMCQYVLGVVHTPTLAFDRYDPKHGLTGRINRDNLAFVRGLVAVLDKSLLTGKVFMPSVTRYSGTNGGKKWKSFLCPF